MRDDLIRTGKRWLKFNLVGAVGIGVQLAVLTALKAAGLHYLAATVLAVEAAIVHNFFWHARYTWADRASVSLADAACRFLKFHVANGAVSLTGNVFLMQILVGELYLPVVPANLLAIATCGVANFLLGDRFVFHTSDRRVDG